MKYYPFRIVGTDPKTKEQAYLGGARTRESAEKKALGYARSKEAVRDWAPFRVLTDAEFQRTRDLP